MTYRHYDVLTARPLLLAELVRYNPAEFGKSAWPACGVRCKL